MDQVRRAQIAQYRRCLTATYFTHAKRVWIRAVVAMIADFQMVTVCSEMA